MLARLTHEPDRMFRAGAIALFAFLWLLWLGYWLDDAFITFRYARNLADGLGPVFNPGETVEGYTSFLWMIVTAVPFAVLPDDFALRAIDFVGLGLGLFVIWRVFDFPGPDGSPRTRPFAALLAVNPVFVVNCADGMETALFMALLLETARACVRPPGRGTGRRTGRRTGILAGGLTAACVLTRPEALPLLVVLPGWVMLLRGRAAARFPVGFAATALPPVALHFAWRLWFYGAAFPNTFTAKATGAVAPRIHAGLSDLGALFSGSGWLPPVDLWAVVALAVAGLWAIRHDRTATGRVWLSTLWTAVAFRVAFDVWSGSEFMGTFRFLAPALPPLFVLADESARHWLPGKSRRALIAVAVLVAGYSSLELVQTREPYREGLEKAHIALGRWLGDSQPPDAWLAVGDAGAIPFFSRLPTLDLWGLSDATIARLPGEYGKREGVADYVLARRPTVIVLWNLAPIDELPGRLRILGAQAFDREIAGHEIFAREYRFAREFRFREATRPGTGYYLDVFLHRPARPRNEP